MKEKNKRKKNKDFETNRNFDYNTTGIVRKNSMKRIQLH